MSHPHEGDKSAGFTGLILGSIAIFVIVFAIVRLTNAMYEGKHEEGDAAAPAAVAAPAATTTTITPTPAPAPAAAAHP